MNIITKGTNIEITEAISLYLNKRIGSLQKFLSPSSKVQIEVGKTSNHHKHGDIFRAELHIVNEGKDFYLETEQSDLYTAIDIIKDEALEVLSSAKDKRQSLFRKGALKIKNLFRRG